MFEIDTHVKIHFGIHAPQRNFTPMSLIPAARNVAVIFIGDRQTQRIELDIPPVFVYIIGIGIAVVVTILIYKIQVVMIRQRFHISNPCVILSSRLNIIVFLQTNGIAYTGTIEIQHIVGRTIFFIAVGAIIETETEPTTRIVFKCPAET